MDGVLIRGVIPETDASVWFQLSRRSYTSEIQYPQGRVIAQTDESGQFEALLRANEVGKPRNKYLCIYPSGEMFEFEIPSGVSEANISALRPTVGGGGNTGGGNTGGGTSSDVIDGGVY